jgi:hypothetical protein
MFSSVSNFKKEKSLIFGFEPDTVLGHNQMNKHTQCFYIRLSFILIEKNAYKITKI